MCGIVIIIVLFSVVEAYVASGKDEPAARFALTENYAEWEHCNIAEVNRKLGGYTIVYSMLINE